jgi:hypothetical protein
MKGDHLPFDFDVFYTHQWFILLLMLIKNVKQKCKKTLQDFYANLLANILGYPCTLVLGTYHKRGENLSWFKVGFHLEYLKVSLRV